MDARPGAARGVRTGVGCAPDDASACRQRRPAGADPRGRARGARGRDCAGRRRDQHAGGVRGVDRQRPRGCRLPRAAGIQRARAGRSRRLGARRARGPDADRVAPPFDRAARALFSVAGSLPRDCRGLGRSPGQRASGGVGRRAAVPARRHRAVARAARASSGPGTTAGCRPAAAPSSIWSASASSVRTCSPCTGPSSPRTTWRGSPARAPRS